MKKFKSKAIGYVIGVILAIVAIFVLSWLGTCGIVKLITLCFGMEFKWSIATGIWLILFLLGSVCGGGRK